MKFSVMVLFITLLSFCFAQPKNTSVRDGGIVFESTTTESCRLYPNPKDPLGYIEKSDDGRNFTRNCAAGTIFSKDGCTCITDTNTTRYINAQKQCLPSLIYDFENNAGVVDSSKHALASNNVDIKISENNTGVFSSNSKISVWRFSDAEFRSGLYITFSILSTIEKPEQQVIFTNGKDSEKSSIFAAIKGNTFVFELETSVKRETHIIDKSPGFNNVTLQYDGKIFRVTCNENVASIPLSGIIQKRTTPLAIGSYARNSFAGQLDNFQLFMCIPKDVQSKFVKLNATYDKPATVDTTQQSQY